MESLQVGNVQRGDHCGAAESPADGSKNQSRECLYKLQENAVQMYRILSMSEMQKTLARLPAKCGENSGDSGHCTCGC